MVTGQQNLRHFLSVPLKWASILRIFQQRAVMALRLESLLVCEDTGKHSGNGIRKHKRGKLTSGHDKIAYRDLLIHDFLNNPLVNPLIVSAEQSYIVKL